MHLLHWFSRKNAPPPEPDAVRILVLSESNDDRAMLDRLAQEHRWSLRFAASLEHAGRLLTQEPCRIIFCDRDQDGHPWREVLDKLLGLSPGGCIFLLSRVNDSYLWREVVQRGGYDVLPTPLKEKSVIQAIHSAKRFSAAIQSGHH